MKDLASDWTAQRSRGFRW